MDYGRLVSLAWQMTWRYRFLWILGFFAGGAAGGSLGGNTRWEANANEFGRWRPGEAPGIEAFGRSVVEYPQIVALLVLIGFAISLAWVIVWLTCQGAMARATTELGQAQPITLRQAWDDGRRRFWRYLSLWLLLAVIAAGAALVVSRTKAMRLPTTSAALDRAPNQLLAVVALLFALPSLVGVVILAIAVSIGAIYAQRALAVREIGPLAAFQDGWSTLRGHLGESLVLGLISLVIGVLASIAVGIVLVVALGLLGGIGYGLWVATGWGAVTIGYGILAGLLGVGIGVVAIGIANTYYWAYWTLAYLHLNGRIGTLQAHPRTNPGPRTGPLARPA
jgi:hypothetical protein